MLAFSWEPTGALVAQNQQWVLDVLQTHPERILATTTCGVGDVSRKLPTRGNPAIHWTISIDSRYDEAEPRGTGLPPRGGLPPSPSVTTVEACIFIGRKTDIGGPRFSGDSHALTVQWTCMYQKHR